MSTSQDRCYASAYLEGDLLELIDGSLWVVKGCVHPGAPIAVPRLVNGKKIKRASEAFEIIARYYPFFVRYVPELGREAPVVSPSWIRRTRRFLHYEEGISSVDSVAHGFMDRIKSVAIELIKLLHEECGLRCGPTGSLLGGYVGRHSDIDINCVEKGDVLECLRDLRVKGFLKPLPVKEFIKELPLVSEILSWNDMSKLAAHRLTQGIFKSLKYTLRIINCDRIQRFLGPYTYVIKDTHVAFKVMDFDYRTPSIYGVELLRPALLSPRKAYFITHRVRFAEVPFGSLVIAKGDIMLRDNDVAIVSLDTPNSKVEALLLPPCLKVFLKTQIT